MKGIIDRLEGETAVILIENENREIYVSRRELPDNCTVKSVVNIEASEGEYHPKITLNIEADQKQHQKSNDLRKALLNRKRNSKLKKKK